MLHNAITASDVHFTIQEMERGSVVYNNSIGLDAIADTLHVGANELLVHIETLVSLSYLQFADKKKQTIRSTFNGKNTIVPLH